MNSPTLFTKTYPATFTPELREVAAATEKTPIRGHNKFFASNRLEIIIKQACLDSGMQLHESAYSLPMLVSEIIKDWPNYSLEEVAIAFKKGVRGHYGDFQGMNIRTFNRWLTAYDNETRKAAFKEMKAMRNAEEKKPATEEEKKSANDTWFIECVQKPFELFLKTGEYTFDDLGNILYDRLDAAGEIKFTIERKKVFWEQAKNNLIAYYEKQKIFDITNDLSKEIAKVRHGQDKTTERRIRSESKRLALKQFVEDCKEFQIDLPKLIKSA